MMMYTIAFVALLPLVPILADDAPARARLIGIWQLQDDSAKGLPPGYGDKGNSSTSQIRRGIRTLRNSVQPTGLSVMESFQGKRLRL